jgi:omega-6 fatty acid desaturase (delta-12 desaturase)
MLNGKELILATKPFAREIRYKSWLYTCSTLTLLLLSLAGTLLMPHFSLQLCCSILSGLLIVRMFVIYHDHQHHTILHKSWLANLIMTGFGIYVLAPTSIWKRSHDHHHKHNSKLFSADIGSYPIFTRKKFQSLPAGQQRTYLAIRHPLTIAFGYLSMFLLGMCLKPFLNSPRKHIDSLLALILHIAATVVIILLMGWQSWLFFIFIPFFVACGMGAYLFYAQHNFPGVSFNTNEDWCYHEAALLSSSYIEMNPVMAWFTGNIGYHHIHHLNARIPFYRLPETMKAIPALQQPKTTSLRARDIYACFQLKVWDADSKKMVGIS